MASKHNLSYRLLIVAIELSQTLVTWLTPCESDEQLGQTGTVLRLIWFLQLPKQCLLVPDWGSAVLHQM
jgi:hypothetical protein